jgi:hypothetical protein
MSGSIICVCWVVKTNGVRALEESTHSVAKCLVSGATSQRGKDNGLFQLLEEGKEVQESEGNQY